MFLFGDTSENPAVVGILEENDNNEPTNQMLSWDSGGSEFCLGNRSSSQQLRIASSFLLSDPSGYLNPPVKSSRKQTPPNNRPFVPDMFYLG